VRDLNVITACTQNLFRIKEAGKGYFHDMNMTRRNGGKTWIAPNVLIREDVRGVLVFFMKSNFIHQKALYFPNVKGQCLENGKSKDTTPLCFGRISLIAMLGSQISQVS
jgi:ATPase complex subunit ATP10